METKLTNNQSHFLRLLLKGYSQYEAYLEAYPNSQKWKRASVDTQASRLMKNNYMQDALQAMKDEADQEAIASRESRLRTLAGIANDEKNLMRDRLRAIEIINKMTGDNITVNNTQLEVKQSPLEELSTAELRQMLDKLTR